MSLQLEEFKQLKAPTATDSDESNLAMNILRCLNLEGDNSAVLETLDGYFFKKYEKEGKKPKDNRSQFYKQIYGDIFPVVSSIETKAEFDNVFPPHQKLMVRQEFLKWISRIQEDIAEAEASVGNMPAAKGALLDQSNFAGTKTASQGGTGFV